MHPAPTKSGGTVAADPPLETDLEGRLVASAAPENEPHLQGRLMASVALGNMILGAACGVTRP